MRSISPLETENRRNFKAGKLPMCFLICVLGAVAAVPLHFLSVEHLKLQERYGKEKGTRIGEIYGIVSGWGFFFFWIGIWVSPQPRFTVPLLQNLSVLVFNFSIPLFHLVICALLLVPGAWVATKGVREVTLRVAETHRPDKVVTTGVYSMVRHPQHLGALMAHVGIFFLLSAWYSLLFTPLMIVLIYLISRKEEEELTREFGKEYEDYKEKVPMLIPKLTRLRHEAGFLAGPTDALSPHTCPIGFASLSDMRQGWIGVIELRKVTRPMSCSQDTQPSRSKSTSFNLTIGSAYLASLL